MNDGCVGGRPRQRSGMEKAGPGVQYTTKDFQLEELGKLGEMQSLTESLEEAWGKKLEAVREQRLLKFDSRTLIALEAMILSFAGYIIQDARNSARQDSKLRRPKRG